MKKIKYILFLIPFLFSLNVFAQDYNVTSSITSPSSSSTGKYTGTEIYNSGTSNVYTVNTRYNGQLSRIIYNLPVPDGIGDCFWTNVNYKVTMNMATNDWRNHFGRPIVKPYSSYSTNWATSNVSFVSRQKITFTFKIPSSETSCIDFVYIDIPSTSISSTSFTGETNWNLSSIILTDPSSSGGSSSGGSSGGGSSTPDYSSITNNQNKNTQDIISNNDSNTSNIIENANENTNTLNESINNVCKDTTVTIGEDMSMRNGFILDGDNGGVEVQYSGGFISKYLKLKPGSSYTISRITGGSQPASIGYCLYSPNKSIYKCGLMPDENSSITINTDNYSTYLRLSFVGYRVVQVSGYICNDFQSESITEVGQSVLDGAQSIIGNNNTNTQKEIDSQRVCKQIDVSSSSILNSALASDGRIVVSNFYNITDYINIKNSTVKKLDNYNGSAHFCYYNMNKTLISCTINSSVAINTYLNIPTNAEYVRFTIDKSANKPRYEVCTNGNQVINDNLNDIKDSLTDETTPEIDLDLNLDTSSPVSDLLTMPLTILNKIFDITDDTCQPYVIPFDFTGGNNTLTFPCIDLKNRLGNSVYNILDTILCFFLCYEIGLMCVSIYEDITSLRDGFDSLYTPKHHNTSTRVGRGEMEGKY